MTRTIIGVLVTLFVSGCVDSDTGSQSVSESVARLAETVSELELAVARLEQDRINERTAILTLNGGFAPVRTSLGMLLVAWQGLESKGNGSTVKLEIGNVTTALIAEPELQIEWMTDISSGPDGLVEQEDVENAMRSITITPSELFEPGRWQPVDAFLADVRPEELEILKVQIKADRAFLNVR